MEADRDHERHPDGRESDAEVGAEHPVAEDDPDEVREPQYNFQQSVSILLVAAGPLYGMDAFVYGALCDSGRAREAVGHAGFGPAVRLRGLHCVDDRYPTLAPGGETEGLVPWLRDDDLEAIDAYEGVDR